ncbi:MAG TPA: Clp protease N-terminal domain-containing protein [Candidatus Dormibacteraeota bacterium]
MTQEKDFKKVVRSRMGKTGESYTAARSRLRPKPKFPPRGYSFDSLSSAVKLVLLAAEREAKAANAELIDTGHLVLAELSGSTNVGRWMLLEKRVQSDKFYDAIRRLRVESPEHPADGSERGRPLPSLELGHAIEAAFRNARDSKEREVNPLHLMVGVYDAAESIGARAMVSLRLSPTHLPPSGSHWVSFPDYSPELGELLSRVHRRAKQEGAERVELEHLLAELDEMTKT